MSGLQGMWNESEEELTILRPNGQKYHTNGTSILSGGHKVFGVETVGNEVHALTGPKGSRQPSRRVKFGDAGVYKGSYRI